MKGNIYIFLRLIISFCVYIVLNCVSRGDLMVMFFVLDMFWRIRLFFLSNVNMWLSIIVNVVLILFLN